MHVNCAADCCVGNCEIPDVEIHHCEDLAKPEVNALNSRSAPEKSPSSTDVENAKQGKSGNYLDFIAKHNGARDEQAKIALGNERGGAKSEAKLNF
jgi:hypothetical protein